MSLEHDLMEYCKNKNNIELRNKIILDNENLIHFTIKKNKWFFVDEHTDYDDLVQEGFYYMAKALETYNPTRGAFSTYVVSYLRKLSRVRLDYGKDLSMDIPITKEDEPLTLEDTIEDESIRLEFEEVIDKEFNQEVKKALKRTLNSRELFIIKKYYGIGGEKLTVKQIGKSLNCSSKKIYDDLLKIKTKLRGTNYFKDLMVSTDESINPYKYISYYKGIDYSKPKLSPTYKNNSPVENIILNKERLEDKAYKKTFRNYYSFLKD